MVTSQGRVVAPMVLVSAPVLLGLIWYLNWVTGLGLAQLYYDDE